MVRILQAIVCVLALVVVSDEAAAYNPPRADLVLDVNTGRVLHAHNADATRHPASTTKVMTLYLLFEELGAGRLRMDTPLRVSRNAAAQSPSKLGVPAGSTITVREAIQALVIRSSNDVSVVVAEGVSGSVPAFVTRMNRTARRLGMSRTTFTNPHGLPDTRQVTTARDLATLAIAMHRDFPQHAHFFTQRSFRFGGRTLTSTNRLLDVPGVDGMKTGFIRASGFNLMTTYRRDGRHIVVVVMGGRSGAHRDSIVRGLLDRHAGTGSRTRTATTASARASVPMLLPPPRPNDIGRSRDVARAAAPAAVSFSPRGPVTVHSVDHGAVRAGASVAGATRTGILPPRRPDGLRAPAPQRRRG